MLENIAFALVLALAASLFLAPVWLLAERPLLPNLRARVRAWRAGLREVQLQLGDEYHGGEHYAYQRPVWVHAATRAGVTLHVAMPFGAMYEYPLTWAQYGRLLAGEQVWVSAGGLGDVLAKV